MFVATLENGHMLIANVAGRMRRSFIRIRRGDRIRVELSPCDLSPGRIVCRYAIDIRRVQDYYQRVQSRGGFKELVKTPPAAEFAQLERMIGAWSQSVRVFRTSTADERWLPIPGTKLASSLYVWGCQHMWGLSPGHSRVTHSRNRTVIGGHQEALVGARGTPEDTPPIRFGTVRPRVQIPGPRPKIVFKSRSSPCSV